MKPASSITSLLELSLRFMPSPSQMFPMKGQAPDFSLKAVDGSSVRLSDYRGKKHIVLVFLRGFL
jgi:hypothetical protein